MANVTFAEAVMVDSVRFFHASLPTRMPPLRASASTMSLERRTRDSLQLRDGFRDTSESAPNNLLGLGAFAGLTTNRATGYGGPGPLLEKCREP